jgi:hypothetical protein
MNIATLTFYILLGNVLPVRELKQFCGAHGPKAVLVRKLQYLPYGK